MKSETTKDRGIGIGIGRESYREKSKSTKQMTNSNTQKLNDPLSPLDIKKKKIIQQIRTLLNDYPSVHPLAHKVLISANYRVLYDLHLNLMGLDGIHQNRQSPEKAASLNALVRKPQDANDQEIEVEISQESNTLDGVTRALERAQRLADKRKILRLEEQEKEDRQRRERNRKQSNTYKDLEIELNIN
jgi:hypothetical protein